MAIKDLQRRQTEVGRIRIGETKDTGKTNRHGQPIMRPVKLEAFRFTSPSKTLIEQVAAIYGGEPGEWEPQGGGAKQWEVYTKADSLPVVVPPGSVSQWYEAWAGGACVRRCDGEQEMLKDQACVCGPDPSQRVCKPTTRISLMLADVPGIGVWRLESHGYYAATELPAVAELLAASGGYVRARLELEERSARREKADGSGMETRRWMVPVLHVDAAPADLLALTGVARAAVGSAQRPAIAAEPAGDPVAAHRASIDKANTVEDLRALWRTIGETASLTKEQTAELTQVFWARKKAIEEAATLAAMAAKEETSPIGVAAGPEPNRNEVWMSALGAAADLGWNTAQTSANFRETYGHDVTEATGTELVAYRDKIRAGAFA